MGGIPPCPSEIKKWTAPPFCSKKQDTTEKLSFPFITNGSNTKAAKRNLSNVNDNGGISSRDILAKAPIPPPMNAAKNIKKIDLYDFKNLFLVVMLSFQQKPQGFYFLTGGEGGI